LFLPRTRPGNVQRQCGLPLFQLPRILRPQMAQRTMPRRAHPRGVRHGERSRDPDGRPVCPTGSLRPDEAVLSLQPSSNFAVARRCEGSGRIHGQGPQDCDRGGRRSRDASGRCSVD
jgi:hypothetical protein